MKPVKSTQGAKSYKSLLTALKRLEETNWPDEDLYIKDAVLSGDNAYSKLENCHCPVEDMLCVCPKYEPTIVMPIIQPVLENYHYVRMPKNMDED